MTSDDAKRYFQSDWPDNLDLDTTLEELRETYAKPVEMNKKQQLDFLSVKETWKAGVDNRNPFVILDVGEEYTTAFGVFNNRHEGFLSPADFMRAWDNPDEVIKVVE